MRIFSVSAKPLRPGETTARFDGQGNLLRVLAANADLRDWKNWWNAASGSPPGPMMAVHAPGRVLLAHPVSPAVDMTSELLGYTGSYFLPEKLFATLPGGRYGSEDEDCFFTSGMKTTLLGNSPNYELSYLGDSSSGPVNNRRWLTKAILDERVGDLAERANLVFDGSTSSYYNLRTNYNAPLASQTGFSTRPPFEEVYGEQFSIGSLEMELQFLYNRPSIPAEVRLRYKRIILGGRLIAFPQGAPGTTVTLSLTARPTLHPVSNGYSTLNGAAFRSIAVPAGRLSVGVRFLPIAGAFTNAYPSPLAADPAFLSDWYNGVMDAGGLADVRSVSVNFPSVSGRDGEYIQLDDISLPFANLKVPESRLGLLFVSYASIVEDYQNAVKKDVLTSLKIYSGFDDLAWSESGGHVTTNPLYLSQRSTWKVQILGRLGVSRMAE